MPSKKWKVGDKVVIKSYPPDNAPKVGDKKVFDILKKKRRQATVVPPEPKGAGPEDEVLVDVTIDDEDEKECKSKNLVWPSVRKLVVIECNKCSWGEEIDTTHVTERLKRNCPNCGTSGTLKKSDKERTSLCLSLYSSNLTTPEPSVFQYNVGTRIRVRTPEEIGTKIARRTDEYRKYIGMFGTILKQDVKEPEGTDEKKFDDNKLKRVGYFVNLFDAVTRCPKCKTKMTPKNLGTMTMCPSCKYTTVDSLFFWEHEVVPSTKTEEALVRKAIEAESLKKIDVDASSEDKAKLDGYITNPLPIVPAVDVPLSGTVSVNLYSEHKNHDNPSDWELVGRCVRDIGSSTVLGSQVLPPILTENANNMFWFKGRMNDGIVVINDDHQYGFRMEGKDGDKWIVTPISPDDKRSLYLPKWTKCDGVLVGYSSSATTTSNLSVFNRSDMIKSLPYYVSPKYFDMECALGVYRIWTKSISYSGNLYSGEQSKNFDRRTGADMDIENVSGEYAFDSFVHIICDIELRVQDTVKSRENNVNILYHPYNMSHYQVFTKLSNSATSTRAPIDKIIVEGYKSLYRFPSDDNVVWSIIMLPNQSGTPFMIKEKLSKNDYSYSGVGLPKNTRLPNGDLFSGSFAIIEEDFPTPHKVNRLTVQPKGGRSDKPVGGGTYEIRKVPEDATSIEITRFSISDKYDVDEFTQTIGARAQPMRKGIQFDWAVIGELIPSRERGTISPVGKWLGGLFKDVWVYARSVVLRGVDDKNVSREITMSIKDTPSSNEYDAIKVHYNKLGVVDEVDFGRGSFLRDTAKINDVFVGADPKLDIKEIIPTVMTFAEQEKRVPSMSEARGADALFNEMKTVDQPCQFDIHPALEPKDLKQFNPVLITGSSDTNLALESWLGGSLKDGPSEKKKLFAVHADKFDAVVDFTDGSNVRLVSGLYSMHFPVKPLSADLALLMPPSGDISFKSDQNIVNLYGVCITGTSYIQSPSANNVWKYSFVIGGTWAGRTVNRISVSLPDIVTPKPESVKTFEKEIEKLKDEKIPEFSEEELEEAMKELEEPESKPTDMTPCIECGGLGLPPVFPGSERRRCNTCGSTGKKDPAPSSSPPSLTTNPATTGQTLVGRDLGNGPSPDGKVNAGDVMKLGGSEYLVANSRKEGNDEVYTFQKKSGSGYTGSKYEVRHNKDPVSVSGWGNFSCKCLPTGELISCNPSLKPIEQIKIGEKVLTHKGNYKKVKDIFSRNYDGPIFRIYMRCHPSSVAVTKEHPVSVYTSSGLQWKDACDLKDGDRLAFWVNAKTLSNEDIRARTPHNYYWSCPKCGRDARVYKEGVVTRRGCVCGKSIGRRDKYDLTGKIPREHHVGLLPDFWWIVGLYLADGSTGGQNQIIFTIGSHEKELGRELVDKLQRVFGTETSSCIRDSVLCVRASSKNLWSFFDSMRIHGQKGNKIIPPWFEELPIEYQRELVEGYYLGDGNFHPCKDWTNYRMSSVSLPLITSIQRILLRLGVSSSLSVSKAKPNTMICGRKVNAHDMYILSSGWKFGNVILGGSHVCHGGGKEGFRFHKGGMITVPIRKLETKEYHGMVYNIEVEDDNTFMSNLIPLHNCRGWTQHGGTPDTRECKHTKGLANALGLPLR